MNIAELSIRKNQVTLVLLILVFIGGIFSYINFPRNEDPDYIVRAALVMTYFPGMSPEKIELLITDKIEKKIQEMPEVDHIVSENRTGVSIITVIIQDRYKNMQPIWRKLKDKVELAERELPEGATKPHVWDDYGDVYGVVLAVSGDGFSYREKYDIADDLRKKILLLPNVAKVDIYGKQEERVFVEISNAKLAAFGLTPAQLIELIKQENIVLPGGSIRIGPEKIVIEPTGDYKSVEDIKKTIISHSDSLYVTTLDDLSKVTRGYVDPPQSMMRFQGEDCVGLAVSMAKGGNIIKLGESVISLAAQFQKNVPIGIKIQKVNYQPKWVKAATDDFIVNLIQAIIIVTLVMLISLGMRVGFIVASLIPAAIFACFIFMNFFNIELQRVSIASLIISLGLMVDCGIVMSESILVLVEKGKKLFEACIQSTKELAVPLLTSTLTTCAAFLPIALAKSSVGEYCLSLFQVVSLTLMSSWVLSLSMIPFLCYYFLGPSKLHSAIFVDKKVRIVMIAVLYIVCIFIAQIPVIVMLLMLPFMYTRYLKPKKEQKVAKPKKEFSSGFYEKYKLFLKRACLNRTRYMLIIISIFLLAMWSFRFVKIIFFPPSDRAQFVIHFRLPDGTRIEETAEKLKKLESFLLKQKQIASFVSYIGQGGPRFYLCLSPEQSREDYAFVVINTKEFKDVPEMMSKVRSFLSKNIPYGNHSVRQLESGSSVGNPIAIRISGKDVDQLYRISNKVKSILSKIPGTASIKDDWGTKIKKMVVDINQAKAKRVGIYSKDIAYSLKMQYDGENITDYREEDKNIPILLRSPKGERSDLQRLKGLNVYSYSQKDSVPLSQLANAILTWEPSKIYRYNRLRTITVSCDVKRGYYASSILNSLKPKLEKAIKTWLFGYSYEFGGEEEESRKANKAIMDQLPIAVFIIIMLMVMQFNCLKRMVIIMITIPLGLIGVIAGLLITRTPFGFMALLGVISLAGIVINNAIVLLDRINLEISYGKTPQEAIVYSCMSRLRPILLTSVTTVGGLIPLALRGGPLWQPMAITVMAGLIFSTTLTLVFVPVIYSLFFRIKFKTSDFI